jgi:hypothetical protein
MKHLLIAITSAILLTSCKWNNEGSINPIIGNKGTLHFYQNHDLGALTEKQRITAHLAYAYQLLMDRTEAMPESEIKQKRFFVLEYLRDYIRRGEFPINSKYEERRPCFIDEKGTYCAVGFLIQQTAGSALAEKINSLFQYYFLSDMKLPDLSQWISQSGFSTEELATVQPTYGRYIIKSSVSAGAGMSYRGVDNGYPSFRLSYGRYIGKRLFSLHSRMEVVGKNDFYTSLSYAYFKPLSKTKAYLRNRRIGVLLGPGLLVEEGQTSWMLKPEIQLNIFEILLFKKYPLTGFIGYAYDLSLNKPELFPTSRNDFSFHIVLSRVNGGLTYK